MYVKVKQRVSQLLSSANYISLTTDIWSGTYYLHSFLSLTAHFIVDSSMEKKGFMLCAWQFDESHTAANILAAVLSHVHYWEIEEKIVCIL